MATAQERDQAINAVRGGIATDAQKATVEAAAKQAGPVGDAARDARAGK